MYTKEQQSIICHCSSFLSSIPKEQIHKIFFHRIEYFNLIIAFVPNVTAYDIYSISIHELPATNSFKLIYRNLPISEILHFSSFLDDKHVVIHDSHKSFVISFGSLTPLNTPSVKELIFEDSPVIHKSIVAPITVDYSNPDEPFYLDVFSLVSRKSSMSYIQHRVDLTKEVTQTFEFKLEEAMNPISFDSFLPANFYSFISSVIPEDTLAKKSLKFQAIDPSLSEEHSFVFDYICKERSAIVYYSQLYLDLFRTFKYPFIMLTRSKELVLFGFEESKIIFKKIASPRELSARSQINIPQLTVPENLNSASDLKLTHSRVRIRDILNITATPIMAFDTETNEWDTRDPKFLISVDTHIDLSTRSSSDPSASQPTGALIYSLSMKPIDIENSSLSSPVLLKGFNSVKSIFTKNNLYILASGTPVSLAIPPVYFFQWSNLETTSASSNDESIRIAKVKKFITPMFTFNEDIYMLHTSKTPGSHKYSISLPFLLDAAESSSIDIAAEYDHAVETLINEMIALDATVESKNDLLYYAMRYSKLMHEIELLNLIPGEHQRLIQDICKEFSTRIELMNDIFRLSKEYTNLTERLDEQNCLKVILPYCRNGVISEEYKTRIDNLYNAVIARLPSK